MHVEMHAAQRVNLHSLLLIATVRVAASEIKSVVYFYDHTSFSDTLSFPFFRIKNDVLASISVPFLVFSET